MDLPHRVDRIAEVFEGVVRPEGADLTVPERPAFVEIGNDSTAVQIDRLVTEGCRKILDAPVGSPDGSSQRLGGPTKNLQISPRLQLIKRGFEDIAPCRQHQKRRRR